MYLSIYRYRVQELTVDNRQMIKPETANRREIHRQDRQPGRTHVRAGHDERTQKGARRAQKAFEGEG